MFQNLKGMSNNSLIEYLLVTIKAFKMFDSLTFIIKKKTKQNILTEKANNSGSNFERCFV